MKFTLAELALATHRANPANESYRTLAQGLTGTAGGSGSGGGTLPAKRLELDQQFNAAVTMACALPEPEIASALRGMRLRYPQVWVETVRPGCRLRTGCLATQTPRGIDLLMVLENSVREWTEVIGWRVPDKSHKEGDRAIYSRPVHMGFGENGIEWLRGDMEREPANVALPAVLSMAEGNHAKQGVDQRVRLHAQADIRKLFTAADFMARAVLLLHSRRLVDPAVYDETEAGRMLRYREGGALRQALKGRGPLRAATCPVRYDVAAVARVVTRAGAAKRALALTRTVEKQVAESKELQCRKTGKLLLDKDGKPRRNKAYTRKQKVSDGYEERVERVTASRPVDVSLEGGQPLLTIRPK